ncbi:MULTISPECIES: hypothetical protein [Oceanibaculum]|uniref:Uncharacterized protein n=2 Tax=Oceanibaculum indicum TaxID=526216 RepID=K2K7H4_9PROT|nr:MULTISPECIES: hypothetical protein [Oceanibaculum]EKE78799.1 hypothetical protein P24_00570 [Oceanibaculum indicum P24]MCH2395027.1 hypothetical protein [Oceanibaculum sp.]RKQ72520.1 hypothetical protein BCL74_0288 [Oceanibaculum indicum]
MTMRTLINKTTLPALLVAGLVGVAATAPASATVWGASDANPTALNMVTDYERTQASVQPIDTGLPGNASGASDADPTAGNRNLAVNVIDGDAAPSQAQLSQNPNTNVEVGIY